MYSEKHSKTDNTQLNRLLDIMARLRAPNGCPWDKKQTMASLTRYTIEEAYEVADAIASNDSEAVRQELGDLLFQIVFYSQIASENGTFDFESVAQAIADKMIRRHPHVFSDTPVDENDLSAQWEAIKASEKSRSSHSDSIFDDIPSGLPALKLAHKVQKQCAKVGFDWNTVQPVIAKVREEIDEIEAEIDAQQFSQQRVEEEIGDALFAMVNLARHCNVDADAALRQASHKFTTRFRHIEQRAREQELSLQALDLTDLEQLWQEAKAAEKNAD
ncbi:nucleoside triphosphate pyrophosphohydrolase [Salinimonas sp. HHU 13199]|uniref:Nucleoside triphosphate pyrophosphohydrolase n=1 Tax=Salinimonas profundi TaxID=2729140 RepID=A0ABR8LLR1_9ALTE|nr:nucleoside triphosphate pyrophosphohydrolase [Salinimonas profundi]MBD3585881.1 nucleoside triphosphate pyrophosphohydrolase [Salinimonas profundi]